MAFARKEIKTVTKIVEIKEQQDVIVLELSKSEAKAITLAIGRVSGSHNTTAAKYSSKVYEVLVDVLGGHASIPCSSDCFNGCPTLPFNHQSLTEVEK